MKKVFAVVVGVVLLAVSNVFAQSTGSHTWELGTEISNITYREPGIMKEDGMMYGVVGSYAYHNNFMLKGEGKASFGQVDYSSSSSGTLSSINDYMLEFRGLGGYDFALTKEITLTPFTGFGYRYLNDDTSGKRTSTGAAGYERESNYFYSPIGAEVMATLDQGWLLGMTAEYDIFWHGTQKSHLSDAVAGLSDVDNAQREGYGCRGSFKVEKKTEKLNYLVEPYIRYWRIQKSDNANVSYAGVIVGYGFEPKNTSTEYGVKLAVSY